MVPPFFRSPGEAFGLGGLGCHCARNIMQKHMRPTQSDRQALQSVEANNNVTKYDQLARTHVFYAVAVETTGNIQVSALYGFLTMVNTSTTTANGRDREAANCMVGTRNVRKCLFQSHSLPFPMVHSHSHSHV